MWWWWSAAEQAPPSWRMERVERQDIQSKVSATGLMEAVVTVDVGTQVSGQIAELLVDFNDEVTAGQVLARLDPRLLQADVDAARASADLAQAELSQARLSAAREASLQAAAAGTAEASELARTALSVAEARARAAAVARSRAEANLAYATIRAPISGTVIRREVDVGQTVNAGMSAPTLYVLAGDLRRMQVLANVDEADIGRVKEDQAVSFTVQAWPADRFRGTVEQVRMQATTTENVVTYGVVVGVDNVDGKLLPGMTATLEIIVAEASQALCAPNAALRFTPEPAWLGDGVEPPEARTPPGGPQSPASPPTAATPPPGGPSARPTSRGGARPGPRTVWTVDEAGLLHPLQVMTGLATASCTEISGEGLSEGMELVAGVERAGETTTTGGASTSPFQPATGGRWRPGGL